MSAAQAHGPARRRLFWVLVALCAVSFAALAPHLVYPDLNLDYPFVDGDSHDWIANGLFLDGADVRYSGRAPLLPLALAALDHVGLLRWWPLLGLLLFLATVVGFYALAAELFAPAAAFAAALLVLFDYSLQGLALDVMADVPASCLMLWSLRAFVRAGAESGEGASRSAARRYAWSGLLAGLAGLTQLIGLLVVPAGGLTLAARRRRDLVSPWPWLGALLALGCESGWYLVRHLALAAHGDTLENRAMILGLHAPSLRFYAWALVSLLGLPGCVLLAAGIVRAIGRACRRMPAGDPAVASPAFDGAAALMALLVLGGVLGFFAFLWGYNAKRFLVYAAWPAALLVGAALARLLPVRKTGRSLAFAAAALLAVATAALPLPAPAYDASWAALWPLPPVAAHLEVPSGLLAAAGGAGKPGAGAGDAGRTGAGAGDAGGTGVAPLTVSLLSPRRLAAWSTWGRAAAAASAVPALSERGAVGAARPQRLDRPDPGRFATARAALFLYESVDDGGGRYRTITRLSAALRRPVRFVPRSCLDRYRDVLQVAPPTLLAPDYLLYPVTVRGLRGAWLLATPAGRPLGAPPPGQTPRPAEDPQRAAAAAQAAAAATGSGNAHVALFWRPRAGGLLQLYLAFLLPTTELYVIEPHDWQATRALLAHARLDSQATFDGARLVELRWRGERTALLSTAPVPSAYIPQSRVPL